jgi:hypothetical protein
METIYLVMCNLYNDEGDPIFRAFRSEATANTYEQRLRAEIGEDNEAVFIIRYQVILDANPAPVEGIEK